MTDPKMHPAPDDKAIKELGKRLDAVEMKLASTARKDRRLIPLDEEDPQLAKAVLEGFPYVEHLCKLRGRVIVDLEQKLDKEETRAASLERRNEALEGMAASLEIRRLTNENIRMAKTLANIRLSLKQSWQEIEHLSLTMKDA